VRNNGVPVYTLSVTESEYSDVIRHLRQATLPQVTYSEDMLQMAQAALEYQRREVLAAIDILFTHYSDLAVWTETA
jgi:hypothetical protein